MRAHDRPFCPRLGERPLFVRPAANRWQVKAALQQQLTGGSGQAADPVQVLDTLPVPVGGYTRRSRAQCVQPEADDGYCAATQLDDEGFQLGLRLSRGGMMTHVPLLPARPHELQLLDEWVEGCVGRVPADQGLIDAVRQAVLAERRGVVLITPPRRGMRTVPRPSCLTACGRLRQYVETVGSPLTEHVAIARIRVHELWHGQQRLIRTVLAQTGGVFLNLPLKRNPLELEGWMVS